MVRAVRSRDPSVPGQRGGRQAAAEEVPWDGGIGIDASRPGGSSGTTIAMGR